MSDVTLVFGGKEFAAHKLILSARSSVLRTLLQDDIKSESVENTVEIPEIGGKELPDHKLILSAGSSVYKITLQHDFKENLEKKVDKYDIPDIDEEVGQELLAFLYTEKAPNLDRFAIELLVASHKVCPLMQPSALLLIFYILLSVQTRLTQVCLRAGLVRQAGHRFGGQSSRSRGRTGSFPAKGEVH